MTMDIKFVSLLKKPLRVAYKYFNSLFLLSSLILCPKAFRHGVFFAGALAGNNGGGLVKVQRLKKYFQERRFNFRIIYSLSNCPYLTKNSLKISKKKEIAIIHNQNGVFYPSWFKGDWALENRRMASFYGLDGSLVEEVSSQTLNQKAKRPLKTGFNLDKSKSVLGYSPHSFEEGLFILEEQLSTS